MNVANLRRSALARLSVEFTAIVGGVPAVQTHVYPTYSSPQQYFGELLLLGARSVPRRGQFSTSRPYAYNDA